jgi:hypothetical protein
MAKSAPHEIDLRNVNLHHLRDLLQDYRARLMVHGTMRLDRNYGPRDLSEASLKHLHWIIEAFDRLELALPPRHGSQQHTLGIDPFYSKLELLLIRILHSYPCIKEVISRGIIPIEDLLSEKWKTEHKFKYQSKDYESRGNPLYSDNTKHAIENISTAIEIINQLIGTPSPLEVDPVALVVRVRKTGAEYVVSDKQWRILKLLNEVPGRILSGPDLQKMDPELDGSRIDRILRRLPEEVRKHIHSKTKGNWIGVSSP